MKTSLLTCLLSIAYSSIAIAQPDSRLVGTSIYSYQQGVMKMVDSTDMVYTGSRSYDPKLGEWLFDSSRSFDENYDELYRSVNTYDVNNKLVQTHYHVFDGTWMVTAYSRYEYTPGGLLAARVDANFGGTNWDSSRYVYTYNTQGNQLTEVDESYDLNKKIWIPTNRIINIYNAAGNVDTLVRGYYHNNSSLWIDNYRTLYTYNTAQQLVTHVTEEYDGTNWNNYARAMFAYNAAGKTQIAFYQMWTPIGFTDQTRYTYSYIGNDIEAMMLENNLNGVMIRTQQRSYLYNTYHQQIQEDVKSWDPATQKFIFKEFNNQLHYYYKDFSSTTINAPSATADRMRIYPVPASNELHLDVQMTTPQHATVMIFDMTGRIVKQVNLPAVKHYNQSIDVSALPAGNYAVRLHAGSTQLTQQVSIVK